MIHIHYFITRKESLDDAWFHRYWRETHGPIAGRIKQLRMTERCDLELQFCAAAKPTSEP